MRITSKGQVTIPLEVRQRMGFLPNTEVDIIIEDGEAKIVKADDDALERRKRLEESLAALRKLSTSGMTTDEVMKLTRGE